MQGKNRKNRKKQQKKTWLFPEKKHEMKKNIFFHNPTCDILLSVDSGLQFLTVNHELIFGYL